MRTVSATVIHMAAFSADSSNDNAIIRRSLPRILPSDGEETTLAQGMSAGIYFTAWELQDPVDYPGDIVNGTVLKKVQAPEDVLKVKYVHF